MDASSVPTSFFYYRGMGEYLAGEGMGGGAAELAPYVPPDSMFGLLGPEEASAHVAADCEQLYNDMCRSGSWPCLAPAGSALTCHCQERTGSGPLYDFGMASSVLLPPAAGTRLWTLKGPGDLSVFVEHKTPTAACLPAATCSGTGHGLEPLKTDLFVTLVGGRVPEQYEVCSDCFPSADHDWLMSFFAPCLCGSHGLHAHH
jgi:hypothetical protein